MEGTTFNVARTQGFMYEKCAARNMKPTGHAALLNGGASRGVQDALLAPGILLHALTCASMRLHAPPCAHSALSRHALRTEGGLKG